MVSIASDALFRLVQGTNLFYKGFFSEKGEGGNGVGRRFVLHWMHPNDCLFLFSCTCWLMGVNIGSIGPLSSVFVFVWSLRDFTARFTSMFFSRLLLAVNRTLCAFALWFFRQCPAAEGTRQSARCWSCSSQAMAAAMNSNRRRRSVQQQRSDLCPVRVGNDG